MHACGFQNINTQKNNIFKINNFNIYGEDYLIFIIKNDILNYSNNEAKIIYNLKINLSSSKNIKIKDITGKITRYSSVLRADVEMERDDIKKTINKTFLASNDFEVSNNHSQTLINEKNSKNNNINSIIEQIVKYIRFSNIN